MDAGAIDLNAIGERLLKPVLHTRLRPCFFAAEAAARESETVPYSLALSRRRRLVSVKV